MHQQIGAAHQRVQPAVSHGPGQLHRHAGRRRPQRRSLAQVGPRQHQPVRQAAGAQRPERLHQPAQVLARTQRPHRQQVRPGRRLLVPRRQGGRGLHDSQPLPVHPVAPPHVTGGEGRDAHHPLGRAHRARRQRPELQPGEPAEVVGMGLEGQVVHGDHAGAGPAQRQEAVGSVHRIEVAGAQPPGQAHLLPGQLEAPAGAVQAEVLGRLERLGLREPAGAAA